MDNETLVEKIEWLEAKIPFLERITALADCDPLGDPRSLVEAALGVVFAQMRFTTRPQSWNAALPLRSTLAVLLWIMVGTTMPPARLRSRG
jgi:hypothetical protein